VKRTPGVPGQVKLDTIPGGSFDKHVYIDAIGVPHGVSDKFKARNQMGGRFESYLFWWATINKNVACVNYIATISRGSLTTYAMQLKIFTDNLIKPALWHGKTAWLLI